MIHPPQLEAFNSNHHNLICQQITENQCLQINETICSFFLNNIVDHQQQLQQEFIQQQQAQPECQQMNQYQFIEHKNLIQSQSNYITIGNPDSIKDIVEYESIIYNQMCESELVLQQPLVLQTEITAKDRGLLVDWLCRLHYKCQLASPTFFRCIGILDRIFMQVIVHPSDLLLIGSASMLIASKIEGKPKLKINDTIALSMNAFTKESVLKAESYIMNLLEFNVNFPTTYMFLSHLLRLTDHSCEHVLQARARYIIEVCASAIEFVNVRPSAITCSAIMATKIFHGVEEPWSEKMAQYTHYTFDDLIGYVKIIHSLLMEEDRQESVFMRRKYGSSAFLNVASLPLPPVIL